MTPTLEKHGSCGDPILVADGDRDARAQITSLLKRAGYGTREAATGHEALQLASDYDSGPTLVMLDVELSVVNGYETCHELRERFGTDLPLMLLSATRVDSIDRIAGLLIGADDYIVKPFDPGELLARVKSLLRRSSTSGMNGERSKGHSGIHSLTMRERQVLDLLAQGQTQNEIAADLFITPKTVATHIQRVLS